MNTTELLGPAKHANQHRLSRLTMESHSDELRTMALAVEVYNDALVEALESAQRKIAELEARTVTVKLPEVRITVSGSRRRNLNWRELGAYNEGAEVAVEKMVRALAAAGIKCEVKGE